MKRWLIIFLCGIPLSVQAEPFDITLVRWLMNTMTARIEYSPVDGKTYFWLKGSYFFSLTGSTQNYCYRIDIKNTGQIDSMMVNKIPTALSTGQSVYTKDWPLGEFIFNKWMPGIPTGGYDAWCQQ